MSELLSPRARARRVVRDRAALGFDHPVVDRMELALLARALGLEPPEDGFSGSMRELALDCLIAKRRDQGTSVDDPHTVRLAMSASDFPGRLANVFSTIVDMTYNYASPVYLRLSEQVNLPDLRPGRVVRGVEVPGLVQTGENVSIQEGALPDSGETIQLATFGRSWFLSMDTILNDQASQFGNLAVAAAQRILEFENSFVLRTFLSGSSGNGPTLRDSLQLFATSRNNLASSGAAFSASTFSAARAALARAATPAGGNLNLQARTILCGPDSLDAVELELAKRSVAEAPPVRVICDALIGTAWYAISDLVPMRHARLAGQGAPMVVAEPGWEIEGLRFKIVHRFGAAAVEPLGVFRNPGA
jgi:hypothetical protein